MVTSMWLLCLSVVYITEAQPSSERQQAIARRNYETS